MKYKEIFTSPRAWIIIAFWFGISRLVDIVEYGYLSIGESIGLLISAIVLYFFLASIFWLIYHFKKKED